jgi:carbonic anhydrase/acetyltransferase-like protein (isoleucine patch superfamily)
MIKIKIADETLIPPFNEPARDLRVLNKPLWLYQRDVLSPYCSQEIEVRQKINHPLEIPGKADQEIPLDQELLVYRDNLFFDEHLLAAFLEGARAKARNDKKASQIAFSLNDAAIVAHALHLQEGIRREEDVLVADLWYFPRGFTDQIEPLVVDTMSRTIGYYHVPTYMADRSGDLEYQIPLRAFLSIENWVHVFVANIPFGTIARGARFEAQIDRLEPRLNILIRSLVERKQFLSSSAVVQIGQEPQIDPTAIIQGPAIFGDHVRIEAGAVITNSIIGNNVTIGQGAQVMASVVSAGCYLPFRAAVFMTTLFENTMVAQNACLQLCVVGRNTFIGAGNTFTDFNLLGKPIRTMHKGKLQEVGLPVLGGCVGNNCRIGSGHVIYPARTIESDVVLITQPGRRLITKNIPFEESDHHGWPGELHKPQYRPDQSSKTENGQPITSHDAQHEMEVSSPPKRNTIERMINRIGRL